MKKYITVALLILNSHWIMAQQSLHIHASANMQVHNSAEVAVFGDLNNQGNLDISSSAGILYFYGSTWTNDPASTLGVGTNGLAIFVQPNALYSSSTLQNLDGGGTSIPFPNISLETPNHVQLINTNSKIRSTLSLDNGSMILNNQNLTIGDGNIGSILQYDETKFIVTNAASTSSSGFLIREQVNASTDFPVGIALGDYTPARINNSGAADNFRVRVFENVYTSGVSGTLQNDESVARTWHIEEATIGGSNVTLDLQHNLGTEGLSFQPSSNYVARYIGTKPNNVVDFTDSEWDFVGNLNCASNISPADITTGGAIAGAARNIRNGFTNFTDFNYYAPATCRISVLPIKIQDIYTRELDNCSFELIWKTQTESNISHFEIQSSWDGISFEKVETVAAKNEANSLYNALIQKNTMGRPYYLRVKAIGFDLSVLTSQVVVHTNNCTQSNGQFSLYPNPTENNVFIKIHTPITNNIDGAFNFYDVLGRQVLSIPTTVSPLIDTYNLNLTNLTSGIYLIKYVTNGADLFPAKKITIAK